MSSSSSFYSTSSMVVLEHLVSLYPYSSYSLGTWIGSSGEKLIVIKKKGIAVSRKGYKHVYLDDKSKDIKGEGWNEVTGIGGD